MATSDIAQKFIQQDLAKRVVRAYNPSIGEVVESVPQGAVKVAKGLGNLLVQSGQGSMRGFAAVGTGLHDIGSAVLGILTPSKKADLAAARPVLKPEGTFQRTLFGTEEAITPASVGGELGIKDKNTAAIVGFGLGIADAVPGGKQTKTAAVGLLRNIDKVDDAFRILKNVLGMSDDVARRFAPAAAKTTKIAELSSIVDDAVRESQNAAAFVSRTAQKVKGALSSSQQARASTEAFEEAVARGLSQLKSDDFINRSNNLSLELFGEATEILEKIDKRQATVNDISRGNEVLNLLNRGQRTTRGAGSEAFAGVAGFEKDEEGKLKFDPVKGGLGVVGIGALRRGLADDAVKAVEGAEDEIRTIYRNTGASDVEGFTRADEIFAEIGTELELSRPGERIFGELGEFHGTSASTFPDWIPEDLRRSDLFDRVLSNLDASNIKFPDGSRQRRLFNTLLEEADARLGVDTSTLRNNILEAYERGTKATDTTGVRGSAAGGAGRVGGGGADVVDASADASKERKFITSTKKAVPALESRVAGQYIPRSTDELAQRAADLIASDIGAAETIALTEINEDAVAIASQLITKYSDDALSTADEGISNALFDKAAEIANTIAPKLTQEGRTIQAASILGRMTPEGQLRFAARNIQKFNEANPHARIPDLTGEQAKDILKMMDDAIKMPDGVEKAIKLKEVQDFIQDLTPTPLIRKIAAVWKAGLLTGLKTTGLNIFSNLSHTVSEIAKDAPAAIVDSVASLFTGKRTKTFTLLGEGSGIREGFQKGARYWKTGFDERNVADKFDYRRVNFGKGIVAKIFQGYTDTVFRALGAQDQPFYYGALARSLRDQAFAQAKNLGLKGKEATQFVNDIVQNPTEEMIRYGVADATTAVFQNKTKLGEIATGAQRLGGGIGEFVIPFGRTPSAVAMQIINYSPIGIAKTIIENVRRGRFDQRLFSQGVGRGLTGTAVLAIGYEMAKRGIVSTDRPTSERERKLWELEGRKANSIKVGNKWRSPLILGPAGSLLLVGAHFQQAFAEGGSPTGAVGTALAGSAKSFTEQTFLVGVNQLANAITDPERFGESYLASLVSSAAPTIASDVARATDPLERRTDGIGERVQARIPGARQQLEPQVDVLGNERQRIGNFMEVLIDPTRPSRDISTPLVQEFRRLAEAGYRVSPTLLGDRSGFAALTKKENTQLWKRTGEIIEGKLENLTQSQQYIDLDDEGKSKIIDRFVDKAKVVARAEMAVELTAGLSGELLRERLGELKAGGLVTQEVFKQYQKIR